MNMSQLNPAAPTTPRLAPSIPTVSGVLKADYPANVTRRVLKVEQAEYIEAFIANARHANPSFEGAGLQTGRTTFYFESRWGMAPALKRWFELATDGWVLDENELCLVVAPEVPLSFTAIAPDHVFETYKESLAKYAEAQYLKEITQHNKGVDKLKERADFIEAEYNRLEEERKAELRAEIEAEYDRRKNPQFVTHNSTTLN